MKRIFTLLGLTLATVAFAQSANPGWPVNSATSDNIFSVAANPAGLGVERDTEFLFNWQVNDLYPEDQNEYSFLLSSDGLGFGLYEVYSPQLQTIVRKYQISSGGHLGGGVYMGARANWWARFPDQQMEWDAGLLYRPFNFLSVGLTASNLLEGNDLYRSFEPGIAIRPMWGCSKLTFSASATLSKDEDLNYGEELPYRLGVEIEPLPGLTLAGSWESEGETIGIAASLGTDFSSVFASQQLADDDEAALRNIGIHFTSEKRHSVTDIVPSVPSRFVEITLAGGMPYFPGHKGFFQTPTSSVRELLTFLEELTEEQNAAGIFLHLKSPALGASAMRELGDALQAYRDAGGRIYTYIEMGGLGTYYLAAHSDRIYMPETSSIDLQGIAIESMFFSGLLDKLGIEMEVIAAGKYKSAMEQFSRDGFSEPAREALDAVIVDILDAFITGIASARDISNEAAAELVYNGPYNYQAALDNGMIDGAMYFNDREEMIKGASGLEEISFACWRNFNEETYQYAWGVDSKPQRIALIRAEGPVVNRTSPQRSMFKTTKQVTYQVADQLKAAREDDSVAGVVLWINSPGGAVMASDMIWHEMEKYHTDDFNKPLVAVMGDVAGSGGYYIACEADTIIAAPTTITGSIGVISGKPNTWRLLEKIGVTVDTLHYSNHASVNSSYYPFTDQDHKLIEDIIMDYYELFLSRVTSGRDMTRDEVHNVAQGRIWSGADAVDNGLIDLLGDLDTGFEVACHLAGGTTDQFDLVEIKSGDHNFSLAPLMGVRSDLPESVNLLLDEYERLEDISTGEPLFLMPLKIAVK